MDYSKKISEYIKRKRKEKGMSQLQLAIDSGVPVLYVGRLELQKVMHPSIMHVFAIAKTFDSNLKDLFEEIES